MAATEKRLYDGLTAKGIEIYMVYGNETFLDRFGQRIIQLPHLHTLCCSQTSFPREGYALWVAEDLFVKVIFNDVIANQFAFFFNTITSAEQFMPELFCETFKMKARCSLVVKRDKNKAQKSREYLQACF